MIPLSLRLLFLIPTQLPVSPLCITITINTAHYYSKVLQENDSSVFFPAHNKGKDRRQAMCLGNSQVRTLTFCSSTQDAYEMKILQLNHIICI